jgi:hypothetical protein
MRCEQGYLCEVCGQEVEGIAESDLYLRYVIGEVDPEVLHTLRERHLRCNPALAQFIVDPGFQPIAVEGAFDKRTLDADFVREREVLLTRGWRRLVEIHSLSRETPILDYPLEEVRARRS